MRYDERPLPHTSAFIFVMMALSTSLNTFMNCSILPCSPRIRRNSDQPILVIIAIWQEKFLSGYQ